MIGTSGLLVRHTRVLLWKPGKSWWRKKESLKICNSRSLVNVLLILLAICKPNATFLSCLVLKLQIKNSSNICCCNVGLDKHFFLLIQDETSACWNIRLLYQTDIDARLEWNHFEAKKYDIDSNKIPKENHFFGWTKVEPGFKNYSGLITKSMAMVMHFALSLILVER